MYTITFINTSKFNYQKDAVLTTVNIDCEDNSYELSSQSLGLEPGRDIQSFDFDDKYLYLICHHPDFKHESLLVFDKIKFLNGESIEPVFVFSDLPRPTCVRVDGKKLYITCIGLFAGKYTEEGLYVLEDMGDANWGLIGIISGKNTLMYGPSGIAYDENHYYVCQHQSSSINVYAKGEYGDVSPLSIIKGSEKNFYYPISLKIYSGNIHVTDYIYRTISVIDRNLTTNTIGGSDSLLSLAWGIDVNDKYIFVANIGEGIKKEPNKPSSRITIYDRTSIGNVVPVNVYEGALFQGISDIKVHN